MVLMTAFASKPLLVDKIAYQNHILTFVTLSRGIRLYYVLDLRSDTAPAAAQHRVMMLKIWRGTEPHPSIHMDDRYLILAAPMPGLPQSRQEKWIVYRFDLHLQDHQLPAVALIQLANAQKNQHTELRFKKELGHIL